MISVSKNNGYTLEKVKAARDFLKTANRRTTPAEEYLKMFNYLRNTNEVMIACKPCGAAKYIAGVENYAKYGYYALLNNGYTPEDFENKPVEAVEKPVEDVKVQDEASIQTVKEKPVEAKEKQTEKVDLAKSKKRGRPSKK